MATYEDMLKDFQQLQVKKIAEISSELSKVNEPAQGFYSPPAVALSKELLVEECKELVEALTEAVNSPTIENKANVLKEMCDLQYVLSRAAVVHGMPLHVAFHRVHENNMLKFAQGTIRPDGKLVKHPLHPKVRLMDLV